MNLRIESYIAKDFAKWEKIVHYNSKMFKELEDE